MTHFLLSFVCRPALFAAAVPLRPLYPLQIVLIYHSLPVAAVCLLPPLFAASYLSGMEGSPLPVAATACSGP